MKISKISLRPMGSRADVGSSQINNLGSFNKAVQYLAVASSHEKIDQFYD